MPPVTRSGLLQEPLLLPVSMQSSSCCDSAPMHDVPTRDLRLESHSGRTTTRSHRPQRRGWMVVIASSFPQHRLWWTAREGSSFHEEMCPSFARTVALHSGTTSASLCPISWRRRFEIVTPMPKGRRDLYVSRIDVPRADHERSINLTASGTRSKELANNGQDRHCRRRARRDRRYRSTAKREVLLQEVAVASRNSIAINRSTSPPLRGLHLFVVAGAGQ